MAYNLVLVSLIVLALLASFIGKFISNKLFMGINRRLHDDIVRKVLKSKIEFFEANPQGRIVNRFSKDIQTLDQLVFGFLEMADYFVKVGLSLLMIIIICPWLIVVAIISLIYLLYVRKRCVSVT